MNQKKILTLTLILILHCKEPSSHIENEYKQSVINFKKAKSEYHECKTEYEEKTGHKIIVSIENGSGKAGIAKKVADYLNKKCFDTQEPKNWKNWGELNSFIISHKKNKEMANELRKHLDSKIRISIKEDTNKFEDITLVIGKDFKKLSFYKNLNYEK